MIRVLVNGAAMPTAQQLPESLSQLAFRNARKVDGDPDFHPHLERLISEIALRIPLAGGGPGVGPGASPLVGPVSPYPPATRRQTTASEKISTVVFWVFGAFVLTFVGYIFIHFAIPALLSH